MSQYGACCTPSGNFPKPGDRNNGGRRYQANDPTVAYRRPTFFSRRLHRASEIVQRPTSISFRESAILAFAAFAFLYRGYYLGRDLHRLLLVQNAADICWRGNAVQCAWSYAGWIWALLVYKWAAGVVPWAFVAAVAVFFGEEVIGRIRGSK